MASGYTIVNYGSPALPYVVYPDGTTYSTTGGKENANCTLAVCPLDESIYGYRPTLPGSIIVIVIYGIVAILQLALGIRYKTWGFMAAMVLGCIDEIIGYVMRIKEYQNPWDGSAFIGQIVTITIGPVFFCAAIYVMIYKIINYIDATKARFNPKLIYWVFIGCDIISLILQSAGGALSSDSTGNSGMGVNIALGGLAFQVATLTAFICICIDYARISAPSWKRTPLSTPFQIFVACLSLATITIFIRCVFRVVELSNGYSRQSKYIREPGLFIGLEMCMIVIAAVALVGAHPGLAFEKHSRKGSERTIVAEDEIKDIDASDQER